MNQNQNGVRPPGQKNFHASAARIAVFSALSYAVDYSFQLVDIFWVARIGPGAPTAIAIVSSVFFLILALNEIIGVSTVPLFSQAVGSGDRARAGFTIAQALLAKAALGIVMALVFFGFLILVAPLYDLEPAVRAYLQSYGAIIWLSLLIVPVYASMTTALRATGEELVTAWLSLGALAVNASLNPLLIFGAGPFAGLGIAGAAWATVIAQSVAILAAALLLARNRLGIAIFVRRHLTVDWRIWRNLVLIGLPAGGMMILYNLEQTAITAIVARFPTTMSDGFGIGARIFGFLFMGLFGVSIGVSVTVGHHIGRGETATVQNKLPRFALGSTAIFVLIAVLIMLFDRNLIALFTEAPGAIAAGAVYLRYMAVALTLLSLFYAFNGAFEGAGRNLPMLYVALFMYLGVELPVVVFFMQQPDFALPDLWRGTVIGTAAGALAAMLLFFRRVWMPRPAARSG